LGDDGVWNPFAFLFVVIDGHDWLGFGFFVAVTIRGGSK